jgi:undecaprenyl diphosphate synthase
MDSGDTRSGIHLGLIPDGNRRWCKKTNTPFFDTITMINETRKRCLSEMKSGGLDNLSLVSSLSIYVLSKDNLGRQDDTLRGVRQALVMILADLERDGQTNFQIEFIGELHLLDQDMRDMCEKIAQLSKIPNPDLRIYAAIAYDPIEDSRRIVNQLDRPQQPPIDMIIRSGEQFRSSGFFPLHSLYSEWFYSEKMFPDITLNDLNRMVGEFTFRKRNFGL